jgi:hypothetical protein
MYELTLMTSSASLEAVLGNKQIALAGLLDNLDGSLSNFVMLTYKSMQTNSTYCALQLNAWRYLQIKDPRVMRHRHNCNLTAQNEVKTRHFHHMVEHYCDHWARRNDCSPLSFFVWSDQSNQIKGTIGCPTSGIWSIKEHSIT